MKKGLFYKLENVSPPYSRARTRDLQVQLQQQLIYNKCGLHKNVGFSHQRISQEGHTNLSREAIGPKGVCTSISKGTCNHL